QAFPDLYVAMIRAAERTSDLDRALSRYITYQQQIDGLRGKLVSAAIYPALLLGVGGIVVLFLLGYVVPRFSHIYEDLGSDLPWLSRLLLDWGLFVEGHAVLLGVLVLAAIGALVAAARSPALWAAVRREAWRLPMVGTRLRVFHLARFYRTLGMLLAGGIPAVNALGMVTGLLSPVLRDSLRTAIVRIREGRGFADTLTECGLITPVARHMLTVGERAGNLGEMLIRSAEFHEEETAREVEWLTRLFGPLLMLFIGCAIGLIVVLMYLPIFQLAESIG
ncbi:MAG TPA: type II secretion system F family protein, partial [Xanthomonadales bacterium]|nr:type II secretion system F family protein [Xanthomonadales bacterium]